MAGRSEDVNGPLRDRSAILLREASIDDLVAEISGRSCAVVVACFGLAPDHNRKAFCYGNSIVTLGLGTWLQEVVTAKVRTEDGSPSEIVEEGPTT